MNVIKISSKGQIVIPSEMRTNLKVGEEMLIIKDNERFVLKKITQLTNKMKEDLEFAKRTEAALKRYEKGKFVSMDGREFLQELKKW